MTDQDHDLDRSPEHYEVRRLLAEARHTEPVPDAVAARLDRVLADLAEEPARPAAPRPVTALDTRRRRVAQLLVAAAAVVVVGIGLGQVLDGTGSDGDSMSAERGTADDAGADEGAAEQEPDATSGDKPHESGAAPLNGSEDVWRLRSEVFAQDAREAALAYLVPTALRDGLLDRRTAAAASCRAEAWGKGSFVPVTYDGAPGVLVFRRPLGDTQVADLFLCGGREPLRSVTLPAP